MSSRRRYDHEDDYRDGPAKKGVPVALIVLVVMGIPFVGVAVGVAASLVWVSKPVPAVAQRVAAASQVRDREDLKAAVLGKTEAEVKALLGVPESTREVAGQTVWRYEGISRDRVTGKTDSSASIYFRAGIVTDVLF